MSTAASAVSKPMLPRYTHDNIRGIVPALMAPGRRRSLPGWMPDVVGGAEQVVLLVIDGLGWEQLVTGSALAPCLSGMSGGPITSVAPSTTATALTSITTGLTPGEHGIVGYRMDVGGGEVMNTLRWTAGRGDLRQTIEPRRIQPFAPFMGESVPVVSKSELEQTAFTEAHLRGSVPKGWRVASSIPPIVAELLAAGHPLVYAYYDGIDKIAHERGFGVFYDAELRAVDRLVGDLLGLLPPGAALMVTSDHGQVQVGQNTVAVHADVLRDTKYTSGEGRFRWLHAKSGAIEALRVSAEHHHGAQAWVVTRDQVIEEGWFGPVVSPPVASRLGDVALVARQPVSFDDPADTGVLICRHGSLTSAEMLVPLLAAAASA